MLSKTWKVRIRSPLETPFHTNCGLVLFWSTPSLSDLQMYLSMEPSSSTNPARVTSSPSSAQVGRWSMLTLGTPFTCTSDRAGSDHTPFSSFILNSMMWVPLEREEMLMTNLVPFSNSPSNDEVQEYLTISAKWDTPTPWKLIFSPCRTSVLETQVIAAQTRYPPSHGTNSTPSVTSSPDPPELLTGWNGPLESPQ